ncbi:DUF5316 domain-containing protein [Brevibacillus daliensis]|uniref:DUF5316 domain-containing protein n=1 Tax=Brevibacillus daliensis TaxID=2892995 RepID=UPI001E321A4C|nr:DUF5316 domain-containing protein [Brevibacillus daliensis]
MLRSLYTGFALLLFTVLLATIFNDIYLIVNISGGIGALSILLSMIFSGLLVSGDNLRANYAIETNEDRRNRSKWMLRFALFGLPNFIAVIIVVYFTKFS